MPAKSTNVGCVGKCGVALPLAAAEAPAYTHVACAGYAGVREGTRLPPPVRGLSYPTFPHLPHIPDPTSRAPDRSEAALVTNIWTAEMAL